MTGKWSPIGPENTVSISCLNETLLGGQSFSWSSHSENHWIGVIGYSLVELRWVNGQLQWRSSGFKPMSQKELQHYLWLDHSFEEAIDTLPWRSDMVLSRAIHRFPKLRILRQPLEETLLVFLLSSAKSIPQIKKLREKIYCLLGDKIPPDVYAFPGWEKIKEVSEPEARKLGMGYRAKYVIGTANFLAENPEFLSSLKLLSYEEARLKLMKLPGVGPKVADCVLLFGGQKSEAFPIDTWIHQSLEKQYGLRGWKITQMEEFARIHFGKYAGLAQQFLFSYQRHFQKAENHKKVKIR